MVRSKIELTAGAYLRPLVEDDVSKEYVDGLNDPVVHRFLVGPRSQHQTTESVRMFVRKNRDNQACILFGFFLHGILRGTARLHDVSDEGAFLGLAIFDRTVWGQGWGAQIVAAVTHFALTELRVPRVAAVIEADNIASRKAFVRAGFTRVASEASPEGVVKELWELVASSQKSQSTAATA